MTIYKAIIVVVTLNQSDLYIGVWRIRTGYG